jgi:hypothetical protein
MNHMQRKETVAMQPFIAHMALLLFVGDGRTTLVTICGFHFARFYHLKSLNSNKLEMR